MLFHLHMLRKAPYQPQVVVVLQPTQSFRLPVVVREHDGATQLVDNTALPRNAEFLCERRLEKRYRFNIHNGYAKTDAKIMQKNDITNNCKQKDAQTFVHHFKFIKPGDHLRVTKLFFNSPKLFCGKVMKIKYSSYLCSRILT